MSASLVPCSSCRRHVRVTDDSCPFCGEARAADALARVIPPARTRLDRWSTFTFATAIVAAAACGGSTEGPSGSDAGAQGDAARADGGPNDDGGMQPLYGLAYDGGRPDVTIAPPYGLPPIDAGTDTSSDAPFDANGFPLYGLPIPPPDPFDGG